MKSQCLIKFLFLIFLIFSLSGCGSKVVRDAQKYIDAGMYDNALTLGL